MKPTPTPEMIDAAERAIDALDYATMPVGDIHREIARAAISAALSVPPAVVVGEPVAWLHPTANWSDVDRQKVLNHCVKDGDMPVPLYASRISQQDAELERVRREVEEARADKSRLDFLDECNARLNAHHRTTYGWEMVMNHNVNRLMTGHLAVDLNDAKAHGFKSCRGAIDEEIKRIEAARAARKKAEETKP